MKPPSLLIIDDEPLMRLSVMDALKAVGYEVRAAATGQEGLDLLRKDSFDVVITDLRLPGASGLELLQSCKQHSPKTEVILITAHGSVETAVEAMKVGAYDYITKPFSMEELLQIVERVAKVLTLRQEQHLLREELEEKFTFHGIVGKNYRMRNVLDKVKAVAATNSPVLIVGEKGTGKDLIANAIHRTSPRRDHAFIKVSCGVVSAHLLEAELFGQAKGTAPNAPRQRRGRFEMAHKGTLFLDEIAGLPGTIQAGLVKALRDGRIERLGGTESVEIDVRVLCASEKDLEQQVRQGQFDGALWDLLREVTIALPPLRERQEDIMVIAGAILQEQANRANKPLKGFSRAAQELLAGYSFPGNVRQLEQIIESAVTMARPREEVQAWDICGFVSCPFLGGPAQGDCGFCREGIVPASAVSNTIEPLSAAREDFERQYILGVLERAQGSRTEAAKLLGLSRKSLWEKCKRYGISPGPGGLDPEEE